MLPLRDISLPATRRLPLSTNPRREAGVIPRERRERRSRAKNSAEDRVATLNRKQAPKRFRLTSRRAHGDSESAGESSINCAMTFMRNIPSYLPPLHQELLRCNGTRTGRKGGYISVRTCLDFCRVSRPRDRPDELRRDSP
jgi:hypothetical protein